MEETVALKYQWTGYFADGKVLTQPDMSSTSLKALFDYEKKADLIYIDLNDNTFAYGYDNKTGRFGVNGTWFFVGDSTDIPKKKKTILEYDHVTEMFTFGYEFDGIGNNKIRRTITIS